MSKITSDFKIDPADIDETSSYKYSPLEATRDISYRKGEVIAKKYPDDIVISADTIVVIDNKIIGKPIDAEDAIRMLKLLSNKTHEVITAYSIFYKDISLTHDVHSYVTFNMLDEKMIYEYVKSKSPLDKAGAYGLQDNEKYHIIKEVKGSLNNVIGFPVEEIKRDLIDLHLLYKQNKKKSLSFRGIF